MTAWRLSKSLLGKQGAENGDQQNWVVNVVLLIWNVKRQKQKNTLKLGKDQISSPKKQISGISSCFFNIQNIIGYPEQNYQIST